MKKQLFWALTLVLLALFPYQNAKADLVQLDRNGWSVYNVSSQYTGLDAGQYVTGDKAIDGNNSTYWHSDWDNAANKTVPHWIVFDLGSEKTFEAFNYVSRRATERSANGQINGYKLYISTDAPTIGSLTSTMEEIKSGTFTYNGSSAEHIVELGQEYSARYVMLYATSTYGEAGDNLFANCAEFYLYKKGYCAPSGNMANSGNGVGRKLNSFTLSDGASQLEVPNIQTSATDAVYKDKTALVLTTSPGATLSFSALSWTGSWMHGYVYIDYDGDKTFDTTANNDGTTDGELVSYNYYFGKNINNETMAQGCGVSASNIPSWTLPSDLTHGEYRLRFKIDWNSIDACGSSSIAADNGCVVDITLRVEEPITSRTITVVASPTEGGVVKANNTVGGVTAEGVVTITAEANAGYRFLRWINTDTQAEVTTNAEFTNNEAGDISYTAVFAQLKQFTINVTQPTGGTISVNGEVQSVVTAYENENITVSISVNGAYTLEGLYINDKQQVLVSNSISFTLTDAINSEINIRAELTKIPVEQLYAAMSKPTFTQAGNLKAVDTYAEILEGSIGAIAGAVDMSTLTTVKTGGHTWKQGATAPIYLSPGAQFSLKTKVHSTTFYGMQFYLLHNTADEILETYGYYGKTDAWDTVEFWAEVNADTKISADQTESTITFPITLPESVKVGDIVVLRAISTATVTSPTVRADEGAYVDYLFHIVEPTVITNVLPENSGTVTMSPANVADIKIGTQVTLTATPAEGYAFVNWTNYAGTVVSTDATYTFNATKTDTYTAKFVKKTTIEVAKTSKEDGSVIITTDAPSEIIFGTNTYNTIDGKVTIDVLGRINQESLIFEVIGGNVTSVECIGNTAPTEIPETVTEIALRNTSADEAVINSPALSKITVVSDAENNVAKVSTTSILSQGVQVVVEKEINTPVKLANGTTPTIFNFLSMPFAFNTADIKYWDGDSWESAELENHIRILMYNSSDRANGNYSKTWETLTSAQGIPANQGFVIVGNAKLGTTAKLQFTSASKAYDGSVTSVTANRYRKSSGETYEGDKDWNFNGVPFLTSGKFDGSYTLYSYNNESREWDASIPTDGMPTLQPYSSVMYQAQIEGMDMTKDIAIASSSVLNEVKATDDVFARAYISIDDTNPAKIILSDESSENFVVNEDAWYMPSLINTTAAAYFNIEGAEAKVSVQPAASELTMTVYTGVGTEHRITLTAVDGNYDVYLRDAATDEVVCLNDEDYTFTAVAKTTISNRFTVSMVEPTGIIEAAKAEGTIKAVVSGDVIKLYGTEEGEQISLYTASGMVIANAVAEDGVTTIATSATGVVIIKVADQTVKVVK